MQQESTNHKTFNYSIRLLAKKDYSIHKIKLKLASRNFNEEHINETVQRLIELKYLNEEEYTISRIKQFLEKGFTNDFIIQKMEQEFLYSTDENINTIREECGLSTTTQLSDLIKKRLYNKQILNDFEKDIKLKNKTISFLATKGYNLEEINSALSEYFRD